MINKEMIKEIWNVIITENQLQNLLIKHPDLTERYELQKSLFGFNRANYKGGHYAPKHYEN